MPGQNVYDFAAPFGDSLQLKMENERLKSENAFLKAQLQSRPQLLLRTESDAQVLLDMADRDKAELALREQRAWKERDEARHQLAQVRALLEEVVATDPSGFGAESSIRYCPYCPASEDMEDVPVEHAPECPWLKARAFLAREE